MDDRDLQLRVSALLKQTGERSATPEEMKYALALEWSDDHYERSEEVDELAETIAEHCREWRGAPGAGAAANAPREARRPSAHWREFRGGAIHDLPPAPSWWRDEERRIWARYERRRNEMLALFGLGPEGLADASDVLVFLAAVMVTETQEGDWLLLDVPLGFVEETDPESGETAYYLDSVLQPVWRGFHRPPPIDADGLLIEPTPAERAREQKLSRLAETAQAVSDETGCSQADAVVFLLCHEQPGLPYVQVERSLRNGGYVITVRDRRIPVRDVAATYRFHRDLAGRSPRQPQEGPYLVEQFVTKAREEGKRPTWSQMFEQFERAYPRRYRSEASFRETFYSMQRKRQGK